MLVLTTTPFLNFDDLVLLLLIKEDVVDADAARVRAFNAATFICYTFCFAFENSEDDSCKKVLSGEPSQECEKKMLG